jgi:hypothetical protein
MGQHTKINNLPPTFHQALQSLSPSWIESGMIASTLRKRVNETFTGEMTPFTLNPA